MAVSPEAQGRGYGNLLIEVAIEFARSAGAETLMLLSNSRLGPALRLYEKYGFRHVPVSPDHEYSRVDVQMELCLKSRAKALLSEDRHPIFGSPAPNVQYSDRLAAYVVILNDDGKVATVKGPHGLFLPGGGSLPDEQPQDTITREVCEELARGVHLTRRIGEATQYFYSSSDDRHYKMLAAFFAGELTSEPYDSRAEHELYWLPLEDLEIACFHPCHVWAAKLAKL
jgi:8-oxo-dGTP diphosphatase